MAETVQFENGRGEELVGTLRVPDGADRPPLVIFVHGWGADRNAGEATRVADELEAASVACLLFDLSGHGESGGASNTVTLEDHQEDLKHALAWARARGEFGAIGLAGHASGAAVAIAVAAEDRGIAALVLRSPTAHARRDLAARIDAPTLLLEDEEDGVLERHRVLANSFHGEHRFVVIPVDSPLGLPTPLAMLVDRHVQWFRGWLGAQPRVRGGMKSPFIPEEPAEFKPPYLDRDGAGRVLAKQLGEHIGVQTLVLALPRGGVEVALPIADALGADFDVLVVRKIRAPFQPELGLGAVAEDGVVEWNEPLLRELGYGEPVRRRELELAHRQLADHVAIYRAAAPRAPLEDRTIILVDDGIATGGTVRAAIAAVKRGRPKKLIVALPGGDPEVLAGIAAIHGVDAVVAPEQPESFHAVSELYADYPPVPTDRVLTALRDAHAARRAKLAAQG